MTEAELVVDLPPEPEPEPEPEPKIESAPKPKRVKPAVSKAKQKQAEQKEKIDELVAKVAFLQAELDVLNEQSNSQQELKSVAEPLSSEQEVVTVSDQSSLPQVLDIVPEDLNSSQELDSVAEQSNSQQELDLNPESKGYIPPTVPVDANVKIKRIIEALLFASEQPMTVKQLHTVFPELEAPEKKLIQDAVDSLHYDYKDQGIGLHKVASGYRFQVETDMAPWVARLSAEKPPRYSRALLETIAIIAYQQPVTRGDIEEIRGVSVSSQMIRTLLEREWVKVLAHKEVPGRPALYGTTKEFLDYFNLPSLDAMPPLEELQALALEGELEV